MIDSFCLMHGDQHKYSYAKYAKAAVVPGACGVELLPCSVIAMINAYLQPADATRWMAASKCICQMFLSQTIAKSSLDLLLTQEHHIVVHADVLEGSPLYSDHCPIIVGIHITQAKVVSTNTVHMSMWRFNSSLLEVEQYRDGLKSAMRACLLMGPRLPEEAAHIITNITNSLVGHCTAFLVALKPNTRNEGKEIGMTHRFLNKSVKTHQHLMCASYEIATTITKCMMQLNHVPNWVLCRLPPRWEEAQTVAYAANVGALCKKLSKWLAGLSQPALKPKTIFPSTFPDQFPNQISNDHNHSLHPSPLVNLLICHLANTTVPPAPHPHPSITRAV